MDELIGPVFYTPTIVERICVALNDVQWIARLGKCNRALRKRVATLFPELALVHGIDRQCRMQYKHLVWMKARPTLLALMQKKAPLLDCIWRRCCELGFWSSIRELERTRSMTFVDALKWIVQQLFAYQRWDLLHAFIGYVESWDRMQTDYFDYGLGTGSPCVRIPEIILLWAHICMRAIAWDADPVWAKRAADEIARHMKRASVDDKDLEIRLNAWFQRFFLPGCKRCERI